jgi:pimeloyl-ACP methyl ester carboxylesterase
MPTRTLRRDWFPVVEHLATSDVPVTVIYGDRDSVVPSASLAEQVALADDPVMGGPRGWPPPAVRQTHNVN